MRNKKYTFIFIVIILIIVSKFLLLQDRYKKNSIPLNVMIIVIDALRPDHLGCYGYERNTSPNIDKLANEGIRFTQAIAPGGITIESVPSILTGTYSPTHQIRDWKSLRNPSVKTLSHELNSKGYKCAIWANHGTIGTLDIKDGFHYVYSESKYENGKPATNEYQLTTNVIAFLKEQENKPFFLYIHYHGTHVPYRLPTAYKNMYLHDKFRRQMKSIPISMLSSGEESYKGNGKIPYIVAEDNITDPNYYISQYDGAISYTDAQIGRLMDGLKELGLYENTLIILTADHGELLGEHNIYFHHTRGYEENIRVPLIIRYPRLFPKGKLVSRQVSLVDIAPTILDLVGPDKPSYIQGKSLLAFVRPFTFYRVKYAFSFCGPEFTLRTENWKLIYNPDFPTTWELYNLKTDPKELNNLVSLEKDKFEFLKQKLDGYKQASLQSNIAKPILDEETKKRLESLGYVQ